MASNEFYEIANEGITAVFHKLFPNRGEEDASRPDS